MHFKIVRLTAIRNRPKRTISVSIGLKLLQMVSKTVGGQCVSEDAGPQTGWIMKSHIDWREK